MFPVKINKHTVLILGIIFVAFNLRPGITAVGPLISSIRDDIGISNGLAGLLTTLPLLAFALLSPFAPKIAQRFGNEMSILGGLVVLGTGILIRSAISLFVGTALIGMGIAICNVLLPGIVKERFGKVGLLTGVYTFSMGLWAGLAPGLSVPLAEKWQIGWSWSLGVWIILVVIAVLIWIPQLKPIKENTPKQRVASSNSSLWQSGIAWQVTLFMGLQSLVYFSFITWLPEILTDRGFNITTAGWMVTLLQFSGLPANFIIPVLADRLPNQKAIAVGIGAFCTAGITGLLLNMNSFVIIVSIILIGIALGAAISHSLTLIGLRAANAKQAADLSGMAQSVGYLLAALGPFLIGNIYDFFHNWTLPLILLILVTIVFTLAGVGAGRNRYVLETSFIGRKKSPSTII
ncbi:CP family cyanate transporter-like MFS transporter [Cytobacillus oceanisediminis]|uniref:CP family cyanate transporter-like MFS transporter n=1 Tax=Cytobacillus oceanisediminis TaxID=665099 RepID=A0A2V2ZN51_9BACI|nr:MFS transporter [Cytobacillus oceanisediminis]PWW25464.1 CP family cyanate transporter-like MFS transporter [Cytobacillus oceanisediminis]